MTRTPWTDERVRTWILFVVGVVFLSRFAWTSQQTLNPYLTTLIAGCIFGKAVLNLFKDRGD